MQILGSSTSQRNCKAIDAILIASRVGLRTETGSLIKFGNNRITHPKQHVHINMKSAFAWFVVIFFALHIPLTLVVDGQVLIPPTMVPESLQLAVLEFASNMKDDLMISPSQAPLWFKAVIACEIFLQVPYFAFAAMAWIFEWESSIRSTMHVYTAHVLTTMVPIMLNILCGPSSGASSVA